MKKLIVGAIITLASVSSFAQHYHGRGGLSAGEAIVLGTIGAIIYNQATQPRVIVQPQYPVQSGDYCDHVAYYNGEYNPQAARSYCYGQRAAQAQYQRQLEQEAYQRGYRGY